ncbi:hypothetical protein D3C80_956980 [compost metagenome]
MLGAQVALAQALHHRAGLDAAVAHGDAGATHQVAVAALVEDLRQGAPQHGDGGAVAVLGGDAGAADLQARAVELGEAVQAELVLAVEAPQFARGVVVEQAGGGDQRAAGQVAHAQVAAVDVETVAVEAQFGALQAGAELLAEHAVTQGLGFDQGFAAVQAFGLQAAGGAGLAGQCSGGHAEPPGSRLRPLPCCVQGHAGKPGCRRGDAPVMLL